ncbi:MAG: acetate--CoA ligase family protein, partial [Pelagibacteraceae bacterium]|nr:acetate--CoA ligase family protein [Pelagibacteraceae bacterium]
MNIHEYQAKELLKKFGIPIPKGVVAFSVEEALEKAKLLKIKKYVLKAQIHAGGRGKAGGVKILDNLDDLKKESLNLFGKFLKTHQTGPKGKEIKRLYIEEATEIDKEFYLSCLVDRASSKIAFISSAEGGMDIEEVALKNPNNVITYKLDYKDKIS